VNKYRAKKTEINGERFDSKREAARYQALLWMERAKEISNLKRQVTYRIEVGGVLICKYISDFEYDLPNGQHVVEDSKGYRTPIYRLKKKLMKAVHGVELYET